MVVGDGGGGMVVVVVGVLTIVVVVVVVGGRKGFPQEVLGSHVTASDLERLMSEHFGRRITKRGLQWNHTTTTTTTTTHAPGEVCTSETPGTSLGRSLQHV